MIILIIILFFLIIFFGGSSIDGVVQTVENTTQGIVEKFVYSIPYFMKILAIILIVILVIKLLRESSEKFNKIE